MGVTVALNIEAWDAPRRAATARDEGGIRRGARDVGQVPAAFRDMIENMCHGGKIAMLGIPVGALYRYQLEHGDLQYAHDQRHLRPGNV